MLVDIQDLGKLKGPVRFVDTRKAEDYARGHIPGAIHFDNFEYANADTSPEGLGKAVEDWRDMFRSVGIGSEGTFVFYDVGMENRAPRPGVMLRFLGNPASHVLHGGLLAWARSGRPLSTEDAPAVEPGGDFPHPFDLSEVATVDDVVLALEGGTRLLDVRDDEEYVGDKTQGNPRLGRIPRAAHLPWTALGIRETNVPAQVGHGKYGEFVIARYSPPEEIRRELRACGLDPSDDIVLYCQRSHRASTAYLALKSAGCRKVRIYIGSFREWSRREDLPIEPPHAYLGS